MQTSSHRARKFSSTLVLNCVVLSLQTWVRAIREAMRERMFSVQSLHQDSATASGKLGPDSDSVLDAYYIRENYQVSCISILPIFYFPTTVSYFHECCVSCRLRDQMRFL